MLPPRIGGDGKEVSSLGGVRDVDIGPNGIRGM